MQTIPAYSDLEQRTFVRDVSGVKKKRLSDQVFKFGGLRSKRMAFHPALVTAFEILFGFL